jgi:hypothetical protein
MLVWAGVAGASTTPGSADLLRLQRGAASGLADTPARAGATTYPVSGTMEGFDGSPQAGFWVTAGWYDPDGYSWFVPDALYHSGGDGTTGADGTFSFANVPSHPGHDSLMAGSLTGDGLTTMVLYHLDFSTTSSYVLRPGHVSVSVAHAPADKRADVTLGDANYSAIESSVGLTGGYGVANAWAPDFNSGRAYFGNAIGTVTAECEWANPSHTPVAVSPGAVAGTSVDFDWNDAVRGRLAGPLCRHSGRPGSTFRYTISNLPAGEQMSFFGQSWSPYTWGVQTYPQVVTSSGAQNTYTVTLRVPKRATVGEVYWVQAQRSDDVQSLLWLYDNYEVCSFAASQKSIVRGQTVRLRGHIDATTATLFMRNSRAGQPANATARGWTKVADIPAAHGRFVSPKLHPARTTWYVVRYHGTNGGFTAFTPVVKVAVR